MVRHHSLDVSNWLKVVKHVFQCQHHRLPVSEGLVHCPDCQQAFIRQWVLVECLGCQYRREATLRQQQAVPIDAACQHCGSIHYRLKVIDQPQAHELHFVALSIEKANESLDLPADVLIQTETLTPQPFLLASVGES